MDAIIATGSASGELLGEPSAELRARISGDGRCSFHAVGDDRLTAGDLFADAAWDVQIHQHDIGLTVGRQRKGLFAVGGVGDDLDPGDELTPLDEAERTGVGRSQ